MLAGYVRLVIVVVWVVGVPVMLIVTTVSDVLVAVPAVNPVGSPVTVKFDAVIVVA